MAFEVAARPAFLPSFLREEFAFLVGVGVLLPGARAFDRLLLFKLRLDGLLSGAAFSAHELCASLSSFVVGQHLSCEPQMAHVVAFHTGVRGDISWAEATFSACKAYCLSLVPRSMVQHVFIELLFVEGPVAHLAAALALALRALLRVALEMLWELLNVAPGARMALETSESPISCRTCIFLPLRFRKSLFPKPGAAYGALLLLAALQAFRRQRRKRSFILLLLTR